MQASYNCLHEDHHLLMHPNVYLLVIEIGQAGAVGHQDDDTFQVACACGPGQSTVPLVLACCCTADVHVRQPRIRVRLTQYYSKQHRLSFEYVRVDTSRRAAATAAQRADKGCDIGQASKQLGT